METKEILERITPIFHEVFNDDELDVNMELTSDEIDDWSSITQMLMVTEIEKEFNIVFKLIDVASMNSVAEVIKAIKDKL